MMRLGEYSAVFFSFNRWRHGTERLLNNPSGGGSLSLLQVAAFLKSAQKLKGPYEQVTYNCAYRVNRESHTSIRGVGCQVEFLPRVQFRMEI